ncbi:MAG: 3-deoxy-7-phosphoheptulonate synthase, partial [Anaerolineaceae bacterium]|nr:3-deoxy-7-phosphoheptulonate synthase [Anaerolineaceae bacterium]
MMIIMNMAATKAQIDEVMIQVEVAGFQAHPIHGAERTVIGVVGSGPVLEHKKFLHLPGVERVLPISRPYKLASRELIRDYSGFPLNGAHIGKDEIVIIAGPCAVEDRNQLLETAHAVREA